MENKKIAMKVSYNTIIGNVVLSIGKFVAGIVSGSNAMISDAVHSASDVLSTFIVMIGIHISGKSSDDDHQYGHERFECVASIILAVILFLTGIGIGKTGIESIINNEVKPLEMEIVALTAAIVSILSKEFMFHYTKKAAKKINSSALMADAWHHRSDALSSVGSFIGILGAKLGLPICDPIASVVICVFILKAAVDIFKEAVDKIVDKSCDGETVEKMSDVVMKVDGVKGIDLIKTRLFGDKIYVDVEISADGTLTLEQAHAIAQNVHDKIEETFADVKHCMVHVNPI